MALDMSDTTTVVDSDSGSVGIAGVVMLSIRAGRLGNVLLHCRVHQSGGAVQSVSS